MMIFQLNNPLNKPRFKYFPCSTRDMLPFSLVLRLVLMSLLLNRNDCKKKHRLSLNISASTMVESPLHNPLTFAMSVSREGQRETYITGKPNTPRFQFSAVARKKLADKVHFWTLFQNGCHQNNEVFVRYLIFTLLSLNLPTLNRNAWMAHQIKAIEKCFYIMNSVSKNNWFECS